MKLSKKKTSANDVILNNKNEMIIKHAFNARSYKNLEAVQSESGSQIGNDPEEEAGENDNVDIYVPYYNKEVEDEKLIMKALEDHILFNEYAPHQLRSMMLAMKPKATKKGEMIISEGEHGNYFYVVQEGSFSFWKEDVPQGPKALKGGCFGELSLLFDSPRLVSVKSEEEGKLWKLQRNLFNILLTKDREKQIKNATAVIEQSDLIKKAFAGGDPAPGAAEKVARAGLYQTYKKGDYIIKKGDSALYFYFIISGQVCIRNSNLPKKKKKSKSKSFLGNDMPTEHFAGKGEYVGEAAFVLNSALRAADVIATCPTEVLILDRIAAKDLISVNILRALDDKHEDRFLRSRSPMSWFNDKGFSEMKRRLSHKEFKQGDCILRKGDQISELFIIKAGSLRVQRNGGKDEGKEFFLEKGDYLGGGCGSNNVYPKRSICESDVYVHSKNALLYSLHADHWRLFEDKDLIKEEFWPDMDSIISREQTRDSEMKKKTGRLTKSGRFPSDEEGLSRASIHFTKDINRYNLRYVKKLGEGGCGKVDLVQDEKGSFYALKTINIQRMNKMNLVHTVSEEKKMLMQCNHTFILKLFFADKDEKNFYLYLEPVLGGDLFAYIYHIKPALKSQFSTESGLRNSMITTDSPTPVSVGEEDLCRNLSDSESRFYISCLVSALNYLHSLNVVYRDIKLENLMIDSTGYLKLVDMGIAKHLDEFRTATICGTPHYQAPEIILKRNYNTMVDCWALGALLFEILVGHPPFSPSQSRQRLDKKMDIYRYILKVKYRFPKEPEVSRSAKELIKGLLEKKEFERMSIVKVKEHRWLKEDGYGMEEIEKRMVTPPFKPQLSSENDTKYFEFEGEDDDEDFLRTNEPMTMTTRKKLSIKKKSWWLRF